MRRVGEALRRLAGRCRPFLPVWLKDALKDHVLARTGPRGEVTRLEPLPGVSFCMELDARLLHDRELWLHGRHEPEVAAVMAEVLRPGDGMLDVGAHRGYFALLGAALVGPAGRVWAFEPSPEHGRALVRHLALNGAEDRVAVCPVALDRARGEVLLHESPTSNRGADSLAPRPGWRAVPVEALDLEAAAARFGIELARVRLVKLDVEGAELRVLEGLGPLLSRPAPPDLVFEVNVAGLAALGATPRVLGERLEARGYRLFRLVAGQPPAPVGAADMDAPPVCNYLARP